jgi:NAD(P)-dependent dehydrogenase (short-subunit alcohol dehydrogenase family)
MLSPTPHAPAAVLVTGVDGPLACAVARRLSGARAPLVLAAPALWFARAAKEEVDRLRALSRSPALAFAIQADPENLGEVAAAIAAACEVAGPLAFVVVCAPLRLHGDGDGSPSPDVSPFGLVLEAVAALPDGACTGGLVLAAHVLPPLGDHDARQALYALARGASHGLGGTPIHVVTVADPLAAAAARAFGLMDRPFGADVAHATRRLETAADAVCAIVVGCPPAA